MCQINPLPHNSKPYKNPKSKSGFTLIELSIVLVIVGLLIGGILVARSMMETARIHSQVKQIQEYDIAVQNFLTTFNQLPGDCNSAVCPNGVFYGDNDGKIENENISWVSDYPSATASGELYVLFRDLSITGIIKDTFTSNATHFYNGAWNTTFGIEQPKAAIGRGGFQSAGTTVAGIWWLLYASADKTTCCQNWNNYPQSPLTPAQALALDSKMDDGLPRNGNVAVVCASCRGAGFATSANTNVYYPFWLDRVGNCTNTADNSSNQTTNTTEKYKLSYTGYSCALQILSNAIK